MTKNGFTRKGTPSWRCTIKKAEEWRKRYDSDPLFRIGGNLQRVIRRRKPKEDHGQV